MGRPKGEAQNERCWENLNYQEPGVKVNYSGVSWSVKFLFIFLSSMWAQNPIRLRLTPITLTMLCSVVRFLADRTNGRAIATLLRLSSVVCL